MIHFDYSPTARILTCSFTGRLDTTASIKLSDQLFDKIKEIKGSDDPAVLLQEKLIFDMTGVNYIASSFIRICVTAAKHAQSGNFCIVNCDPFLKKTFKIAGLDEVLSVQ